MKDIDTYAGDKPYIFISYSHKDSLVPEILNEISASGHRIWYDRKLKTGSAWADEICDRIKKSHQFIVLLTENALASEHVKNEIHLAVKYEKNVQVVFLSDVNLDGGMELLLDRKQAIRRQDYSTMQEFLYKLIRDLAPEARENHETQNTSAKSELDKAYIFLCLTSQSPFVTTYKAYKRTTNLPVFVKHFSFFSSTIGDEIRDTAYNEISILKQMQERKCPYTPMLLDYFIDEKNIYIVEQYVGDYSLTEYMSSFDRENIPALEEKCVSLIINTATALRYLHQADSPVVHRDIKPKNLVVTDYDDICLVDFDCCLHYMNATPNNFIALGTAGYAAPEQYNSSIIPTPRTDIYSLGVLLFHLLTGVNPTFQLQRFSPPPPLRSFNKKFHPVLEKILIKMTSPDNQHRHASVDEVISDLRNYRTSHLLKNTFLLITSNIRLQKINAQKRKKVAVPPSPPQPPVFSAPGTTKVHDLEETTILPVNAI